jgi:hypothetical protein
MLKEGVQLQKYISFFGVSCIVLPLKDGMFKHGTACKFEIIQTSHVLYKYVHNCCSELK